jgi:hypothetical protein
MEENMKRLILLLVTSLLFLPLTAKAGGSFLVEDIKPVLAQVPEIEKYIFSTLELGKSGDASMIGSTINPRLGGTRLGPYCINAKPKGATGGYVFTLCINTEYDFRDKKGKSCGIEKAYSVKETFLSMEIKPLKE